MCVCVCGGGGGAGGWALGLGGLDEVTNGHMLMSDLTLALN